MTNPPKYTPGESLLHPIAILAIATLALNDHYLKEQFPSWWTGKLSDFAGMIFFPLLLEAFYEWSCHWKGTFAPSKRVSIITGMVTGSVFALTNTVDLFANLYRWTLGTLQWPFYQIKFFFVQGDIMPMLPVKHVMDPTDVVAIPFCGIAVWISLQRLKNNTGG